MAPRWGQAVGAGGSPDDVCVKECDPHAAVHQSLPSTEQPHVRPTDGRHLGQAWGGRCEPKTQLGKSQQTP